MGSLPAPNVPPRLSQPIKKGDLQELLRRTTNNQNYRKVKRNTEEEFARRVTIEAEEKAKEPLQQLENTKWPKLRAHQRRPNGATTRVRHDAECRNCANRTIGGHMSKCDAADELLWALNRWTSSSGEN